MVAFGVLPMLYFGGVEMFKKEASKIRHKKRAKQIIDFKGLIDGKMMPTDIDAVIEYKNKAYVFIEVKHIEAKLPFGQKLALERLVKDTEKAGKKSIAFVVVHETKADEDVDLGECNIRRYFFEGQWVFPETNINIRDAVNKFLKPFRSDTK